MASRLNARRRIKRWCANVLSSNIMSFLTSFKNWTDLYVSWSPLGTYLASLHRPGVRLWGGSSWSHQQRFAHPLVRLLDFSPNENYLVTWSHDPIVVPEGAQQGPQFFSPEDEGNNIAVWDIKTGNLLRTFPSTYPEPEEQAGSSAGKKPQMPWPALKWSADDKYVARVTPGQQISVYELPSMGLVEKKSIKIPGVIDFEWCPLGDKDREDEAKAAASGKGKKVKQSMLAYWTPEKDEQPARVSVMEFPSRQILRQKNLFNVTEVCGHLNEIGDSADGLPFSVNFTGKTRAISSVSRSIATQRRRSLSSATWRSSAFVKRTSRSRLLSLKVRLSHSGPLTDSNGSIDTVVNFSWEPKGERFAIVSSNDPNLGNPGPGITIKTDVSFYAHDRTKGNFRLLKTLPGRTSNTIRWSPKGRHVVLATVGSTSKSELEFWDLDFNFDDFGKGPIKDEWGSGIQHLGTADHYAVTDAEWDPSGRYLATSASAWRHTVSVQLFSFTINFISMSRSLDRKWLCYLGLQRNRTPKAHPRSLQTVPLASPSPHAPHKGPTAPNPTKPQRILASIRRRRRCGGK